VEPRLAIVVPSRDRPELLADCLAAVAASRRPGDELIVADSASTTQGTARAADRAGARVVRCDRPGASAARNAAAASTDAEVLLFTDDDCLPAGGWASAMAEPFVDPTVGWATGRVAADRETRLPLSVTDGLAGRRFRRGDDPFDAGHGANMAFRRSALLSAGGFDEALGAGVALGGAEDADALWRVLQLGWEGVQVPGAVVVHRQWRPESTAMRSQWRYGLGAGAFAVKAHRLGMDPDWLLLRRAAWERSAALLPRHLRAGYQTGAAADALRFAGALIGSVTGRFKRLGAGNFSPVTGAMP